MTHVPYKGGAGPAVTALVSGETQVMFTTLPSVVGFAKAGRLRPLAVTSPARLGVFPEVPTTTELGNKQDGSAGINPDLKPQRTTNFELGTRGFVGSAGIRWDVAVFEARVHDELVPFDIPNGNGRRFFRNAGETL